MHKVVNFENVFPGVTRSEAIQNNEIESKITVIAEMTWQEWTYGQDETRRTCSGYTLPFKKGGG